MISAPVPKEKPEREIRLGGIYTNSTQPNLRYHKLGIGNPEYDDLQAVKKWLSGCRVSNLFLVRGDDFRAALRDTRKALTDETGAETADERKAREASRQAWLFVYLGVGPSEPPQWTIESAKVYTGRVVACYSPVRHEDATRDGRCYVYWVPLGELKAGRYTLELVDHDTNELDLLRREQIGDGK